MCVTAQGSVSGFWLARRFKHELVGLIEVVCHGIMSALRVTAYVWWFMWLGVEHPIIGIHNTDMQHKESRRCRFYMRLYHMCNYLCMRMCMLVITCVNVL